MEALHRKKHFFFGMKGMAKGTFLIHGCSRSEARVLSGAHLKLGRRFGGEPQNLDGRWREGLQVL